MKYYIRIEDNVAVEIAATEDAPTLADWASRFHESLTWVEGDAATSIGDEWDGSTFTTPPPPPPTKEDLGRYLTYVASLKVGALPHPTHAGMTLTDVAFLTNIHPNTLATNRISIKGVNKRANPSHPSIAATETMEDSILSIYAALDAILLDIVNDVVTTTDEIDSDVRWP